MTQNQESDALSRAIKLLHVQQKMLRQAGAPSDIVGAYGVIIKHFAHMSREDKLRLLKQKPVIEGKATRSKISPDEASHLSLDAVEQIINDEGMDRKTLEAIAIARFDVPKGSMRSFSNMSMLREKLETLVQNERAHQTISAVASQARG